MSADGREIIHCIAIPTFLIPPPLTVSQSAGVVVLIGLCQCERIDQCQYEIEYRTSQFL